MKRADPLKTKRTSRLEAKYAPSGKLDLEQRAGSPNHRRSQGWGAKGPWPPLKFKSKYKLSLKNKSLKLFAPLVYLINRC